MGWKPAGDMRSDQEGDLPLNQSSSVPSLNYQPAAFFHWFSKGLINSVVYHCQPSLWLCYPSTPGCSHPGTGSNFLINFHLITEQSRSMTLIGPHCNKKLSLGSAVSSNRKVNVPALFHLWNIISGVYQNRDSTLIPLFWSLKLCKSRKQQYYKGYTPSIYPWHPPDL